MNILVTGGCGYIGSHTVIELLNRHYNVIIIDNLSNSKEDIINKIETITTKKVKFYKGDLRDKNILKKIFNENSIDVVIHFAGLKSVNESVTRPLEYYDNNIYSTTNLLEIMNENNCKKIIFSSSATVYGLPEELPIKENAKLKTTNPYGSTKLIIEEILKDMYKSDNQWSIIILRYFNPIGAHESGIIGENPKGIPNNLMPYMVKVANNELDYLKVYGDDYDTPDGTGIRDYIHVVDLSLGHVNAINKIKKTGVFETYNLGTGKGYSVLEMINIFNRVNNLNINYKITSRRKGDIAVCYADNTLAIKKLGWKPIKTIEDMCRDSYNYYMKNK